jgi:hypothetical protein
MRKIITVITGIIALLGVSAPLSASSNPDAVPVETIEFDEWIVPSVSTLPIEYIEFEPDVFRECTPSCTIEVADNSLTPEVADNSLTPKECFIQDDSDLDNISAEITIKQEPFLK